MLVVLLEHEPQFCFDELGQALFHRGGHFTPILTVSVSHCEKVTVLEAAKVGHCNPRILIHLVRVGRRLASFGCKGKFGHAICEHLTRVCRVERVLRWGFGCNLLLLLLLLILETLRLGLTLSLRHR